MGRKKSDWVLWLLGAACFMAVIFLWLISKMSWSGTGHEIVLMGDSVVGNQFYNGDPVDEVLSEKTGMEVFNGAFGGSSVVSYNDGLWETLGSESFSFEALVNAIVLRDFSAQNAAIERNATQTYFAERLENLEQTDFSKTDILVVCFGANDYANQISPDVFEEAFSNSIGRLQAAYPSLTIYISSPVFNYLTRDGEQIFCDSGEWGDYLLEEYVLAQERVAEEYGVCFIDNYHDSVINADTIYDYTITADGLHLNKEGRDVLTDTIAAVILSGGQQETD
ncbi:MAG: SGNH/GDSL hydrolase family protein [Lachnospiraceae bacterium]|nr:SGNH/GDSL hydrolase family protein [Lachnospiraceae bacterium]